MFCEKCGAKIPEGANFCENCGSPVEVGIKIPSPETNFPAEQKKSYTVWIVAGAAMCLAAVVVIVFLMTGSGKESVSTQNNEDPDVFYEAQNTPEQVQTPSAMPTSTPWDIPPESGEEMDEETGEEEDPDAEEEKHEEVIEGDPVVDTFSGADCPREEYENYIDIFTNAVNTGNTEALPQVMSGKICKQQSDMAQNYFERGIQEEVKSVSVQSVRELREDCAQVRTEEKIKVFYADNTSKVVKQAYCYTCKYINQGWYITDMKAI